MPDELKDLTQAELDRELEEALMAEALTSLDKDKISELKQFIASQKGQSKKEEAK
ncbi:MAG: hypothetical protein HON23_04970 [Rickettsiales bacterium]|jgi:hypothetical protein|nr:hypothetical protein [Rickettsiales bacterium]